MSDDREHLVDNVACPICKSLKRKLLRELSEVGYWFVECEDCAMHFYSPRLEERYLIKTHLHNDIARDEAVNMYERGVFFGPPMNNSPEEQKAAVRSYYDHMIKQQAALFRATAGRDPESMFEVGSSVGWYLVAAREGELKGKGPLAGCDANPFAAQMGSEKFGIPIFPGTFQDYQHFGQQYDLIVCLDYIEHTYTPLEDLIKLRNMASPGAVMILKTFVEEHDPKGAYVNHLFHANHFHGHNLKDCITRAGWKIHSYDDETERVYSLASVTAVAA